MMKPFMGSWTRRTEEMVVMTSEDIPGELDCTQPTAHIPFQIMPIFNHLFSKCHPYSHDQNRQRLS